MNSRTLYWLILQCRKWQALTGLFKTFCNDKFKPKTLVQTWKSNLRNPTWTTIRPKKIHINYPRGRQVACHGCDVIKRHNRCSCFWQPSVNNCCHIMILWAVWSVNEALTQSYKRLKQINYQTHIQMKLRVSSNRNTILKLHTFTTHSQLIREARFFSSLWRRDAPTAWFPKRARVDGGNLIGQKCVALLSPAVACVLAL